ncbi:hypothetical protein [Cryptosporangium sp. NPDC048952]|uniref:hypothetical protein n=1 Tax=Cryptosporangium sp. NPDC048952 TaxID=3363961 RepID=UPI00371A9061
MGEVLPLPHRGDVFLDPRGEGRSLRVSGHRGAATVVLSIWRQGECRATFRLAGSEVDEFIRALLNAAPPSAPGTDLPAVAGEALAPSVLQVQISGNVVVELTNNASVDVDQDVVQVAVTASETTNPTKVLVPPDEEVIEGAATTGDVLAKLAALPEEGSADASERPAPGGDDPPGPRPGPDATD